MTRTIGAQLGLLAFGTALVAGLYAGNSVVVILTRALIALVAGALLGQIVGVMARALLRDHLQKRKADIDSEHVRQLQASQPSAQAATETPTDEGLAVADVTPEP